MGEDLATRFLTTRELAALLRLGERKVYELAASGEVPCSRATGKLLFPRAGVEAWLARHGAGGGLAPAAAGGTALPPTVVAGSHDPLLDWALRESGAALATLFDGSGDGLERFARGEALAAGLHLPADAADEDERWNLPAVRERVGRRAVVLVEFAWRLRGLVLAPALEDGGRDVAALVGRRVVARQAGAGGQLLLERLLAEAGIDATTIDWTAPARTEGDAVRTVADGEAEIAFGLAAPARRAGLRFVPLARERFDLLVDRRAWFEPPWQRFLGFCAGEAFRDRAALLGGYDVAGFGRVRFNGEG